MRKRLLQQFVFIVVLSLVWGQWPWSLGPQVAEAATGKMLLLWDPANGSVPSGWSYVSAADGRYLRGGSVAEAATTGGAATHSNTVSSFTVGNASAVEGASPLLGSGTFSNPTHTHAINWPGGGANEQSISSVINNNPAYRTLQLIAYNAGIPNVIPQNAIALFDSSPGILPGWSAYSSQNSRLVKIGNTVTTGGSDTHSATITWPSLGAPSGTQTASTLLAGGGNTYAPTSHTHAAPTSTTYSGLSSLPPYVEPVLGRLNSATTTLPGGFMALFDGDPGQGWNIKSNSGGTFYHQFLRPASSYNGTSQGNATETLNGGSPVVATTGGASSSNGTNGTRVAAGGHTHSFTATFAPTDIQPPYYNVVVAKKLGFSLSSFRWYDNSGSQDVTSPWGEPDFGQNASIKPIPVANNAPKLGTQLRLRVNLILSGDPLTAGSMQFKLQFRQTTDTSCFSGTWTDVGASGSTGIGWRYATSGVSNGTVLTASRLAPAADVLQSYNKTNPTVANPAAAAVGDLLEYDFHIEHNGAVDASRYMFRLVELEGTLLEDYDSCPSLTTAPGTNNLLRGGQYWEDQQRSQGYYWAN